MSKQIITIINKFKFFVLFLYYFSNSLRKPTYVYKLIGERIGDDDVITISFKVKGKNNVDTVELRQILACRNFLECFSSSDTFILGRLTFKNIILKLPAEKQKITFEKMKKIMLNSIHDVMGNEIHFSKSSRGIDYLDDDHTPQNNFYPCKLVGGTNTNTTIIYTFYGKREGYKVALSDLISNTELLEKFHPTETLKFGFISYGDTFFCLSEPNQ